jgi:hypothetical protein
MHLPEHRSTNEMAVAVHSVNRIALKEWAVVCRALDAGLQSILLRKGGIDEGPDGFRMRHREFWLLPTRFHEGPESLGPGHASLLDQTQAERPEPGKFRVARYGVVVEAREIIEQSQVDRLARLQILSAETLQKRFHYRQPGLSLIVVRVYRLPEPHFGIETPELAGCRSWAELPTELPTADVQPVLSDEQFAAVQEAVSRALVG